MILWLWNALAGLFSGTLGSMGMGGGGILVIWLTLGAGVEQQTAQGINLLLFLPCAVPALFSYSRKKLVCWKAAAFCALAGLAGVLLGVWLSTLLEPQLLRRIFGAMLIVMAVREFWGARKKKNCR